MPHGMPITTWVCMSVGDTAWHARHHHQHAVGSDLLNWFPKDFLHIPGTKNAWECACLMEELPVVPAPGHVDLPQLKAAICPTDVSNEDHIACLLHIVHTMLCSLPLSLEEHQDIT
jgi:hypothetical protein